MSSELKTTQELSQALNTFFNRTEIADLLDAMELDYENMSGDNKQAKALSISTYCRRNSRLIELQNQIAIRRPALGWPIIGNTITRSIEVTEVPPQILTREVTSAPVTHVSVLLAQAKERLVELTELLAKIEAAIELME